MILSRWLFFFSIWMLLLLPFLLYKWYWLSSCERAVGRVSFHGREYAGQLVRNYSVVNYSAGTEPVYFNTPDNMLLDTGSLVQVLYKRGDPYNARVNNFASVYNDLLIPACILTVTLLLIMVHPEIIPYGSRIQVNGSKPFIQIFSPPKTSGTIND